MAGTVEQKLSELGIVLHQPNPPIANYVGFVRTGNLLFVSGQVCNTPEGKLIAKGSVTEVIAQSGLTTFVLEGPHVRRLLHTIQSQPGVDYAGFFGAALHVSGRDRAGLENAIAPYRGQPGIAVSETPPNLEDVFIHLQEQAR